MPVKFRALLTASILSLGLAACGGSSSSPTPTPVVITPPPPVVDTGPTWTQGVFADDSEFVAQCQNPRTGIDPSTNAPFVDTQGSTLIEKFWQRSWNNDTYLWYDEVTDINPAATNPDTEAEYTLLDYFAELRTKEITPSGKAKDEFHFTQDTAERFERVSSGASGGYGAQYAFLESRPPRDVRIAFTEENTPFSAAGVVRGAKILSIDGEDAINGNNVDVLNNGLFPEEGKETVFVFEDTPGAEPRTVTVTATAIVSNPVYQSQVIEQGDDKVGYMVFNTFGTVTAEKQLFDAFTDLAAAEVDDLVIDLRYNGGGFVAIAAQLGYMIAGDKSQGLTFEVPRFNDKHPTVDPVTGRVIRPTPFIDETIDLAAAFGQPTLIAEGQDLPTLNLDRVFVLSTEGTCSASELLVNSLRGIDVDVILVGNTTCGKPFGFYTTDNCGVSYSTVQFQTVNAKGFGDYADGFTPGAQGSNVPGVLVEGCVIEDDFSNQLGDNAEAMLSGALTYRSSDSCPTTTSAKAKITRNAAQSNSALDLRNSSIFKREMSYKNDLIRDKLTVSSVKDDR